MSLLGLWTERPRGGMAEAAALTAHRQLQGQTLGAMEREAQQVTRAPRLSTRLLARALASIKSRQPSSRKARHGG